MYKIESPEDGGKAPNGPNFMLIVVLFTVAIAVCFGIAYLVIPEFGRYIHAVRPDHHATSQVTLRQGDRTPV
jgi:ABC-type branched-subunit amino acid transport system permease subunit